MSKSVIELCARAVWVADRFEGRIFDSTNSEADTDSAMKKTDCIRRAKAVLTTLAANLDQEALKAAYYEMEKSTVRGSKLENAIQSYLNALIKDSK